MLDVRRKITRYFFLYSFRKKILRPWLSLCPTVYKADLYGSQLQITGCGFLKSCTFFSAYLSEETDFCRNL